MTFAVALQTRLPCISHTHRLLRAMATQAFKGVLPRTIRKARLTVAGATPESKNATERLLEQDREAYHCFYGPVPFHNHLSHHIFAAYDLGASSKLLQAIYDEEAKEALQPVTAAGKAGLEPAPDRESVKITSANWTKYLGDPRWVHPHDA